MDAITAAGYRPGKDIGIGMDVAASEFHHDGKYVLKSENKRLSSGQMIGLLEGLIERYPIISIEDGLAEDDWAGWKSLTDRLGGSVQVVGDDISSPTPGSSARVLNTGSETRFSSSSTRSALSRKRLRR